MKFLITITLAILSANALEDPDLIRNCGDAKALALGLPPRSSHHHNDGLFIPASSVEYGGYEASSKYGETQTSNYNGQKAYGILYATPVKIDQQIKLIPQNYAVTDGLSSYTNAKSSGIYSKSSNYYSSNRLKSSAKLGVTYSQPKVVVAQQLDYRAPIVASSHVPVVSSHVPVVSSHVPVVSSHIPVVSTFHIPTVSSHGSSSSAASHKSSLSGGTSFISYSGPVAKNSIPVYVKSYSGGYSKGHSSGLSHVAGGYSTGLSAIGHGVVSGGQNVGSSGHNGVSNHGGVSIHGGASSYGGASNYGRVLSHGGVLSHEGVSNHGEATNYGVASSNGLVSNFKEISNLGVFSHDNSYDGGNYAASYNGNLRDTYVVKEQSSQSTHSGFGRAAGHATSYVNSNLHSGTAKKVLTKENSIGTSLNYGSSYEDGYGGSNDGSYGGSYGGPSIGISSGTSNAGLPDYFSGGSYAITNGGSYGSTNEGSSSKQSSYSSLHSGNAHSSLFANTNIDHTGSVKIAVAQNNHGKSTKTLVGYTSSGATHQSSGQATSNVNYNSQHSGSNTISAGASGHYGGSYASSGYDGSSHGDVSVISNRGKKVMYKGDGYYDAHPKYKFEYAVNDPHTGDVKEQKEQRDGDVVKGEYSLVEPNGNVRTVSYQADWETGFHAQVHNSKKN